jgi:osmotically-inducible protein OsmY
MTEKQLQQAVMDELDFEPIVRSTDIGVSVHEGVVSLSGFVDSYGDKFDAERAVKRVFGVKGIANDLQVKLPNAGQRTDPEIAEAAVHALEASNSVPRGRIKVTVRDGVVLLDGEVDWKFQSMAAEDAIRHLSGVRDIRSHVRLKPHASAMDVKSLIEGALRRSAEVEARRIAVETTDGKVILRGSVHSWHEHGEVVNAAWRAPGVTLVEDRLTVQP